MRFWWNRFGPMFAAEIRRKRVHRMRAYSALALALRRDARPHQRRAALPVAGGGPRGRGARVLRHEKRDKAAALRLIKKALKRHGSPKAITTDGLRPYKAAMKELGNAKKQEVGRWANNRAENSHQPFRRRERAMLRFRRMHTLQKFGAVHASFHNHFAQQRHLTGRRGGAASPCPMGGSATGAVPSFSFFASTVFAVVCEREERTKAHEALRASPPYRGVMTQINRLIGDYGLGVNAIELMRRVGAPTSTSSSRCGSRHHFVRP